MAAPTPLKVGLAALALTLLGSLPARSQQATEWGWPQPYEQVSAKSVEWLKQKGWWPIQVAFQAPWPGQNNINIAMDKLGLMTKRGVDAKWQAFASGPAINEVLVSARFQVANSGNFPFSSLLDKQVPVKAIAIVTPNIYHATIVPLDSKIKTLADFKGSSPPATIGIVTGSSAEFYFQIAAQAVGLQIGKDVILKNMPVGEQMAMPKGLDAVVPWDSPASMILHERKNGRPVDSIFSYNIYEGNFVVRQELIDSVPDVVQALSDAYAEATLWVRLNPEESVKQLQADPNMKNFSREILVQQTRLYGQMYKPTYIYPHGKFWGDANDTIFKWLQAQKRLTRPLKSEDFEKAVDASFMGKTFAKLGWTVPKQPPFIPADWKGKLDQIPYPPYLTPVDMKEPQAFPEKGDLVKPWSYGGKTFAP